MRVVTLITLVAVALAQVRPPTMPEDFTADTWQTNVFYGTVPAKPVEAWATRMFASGRTQRLFQQIDIGDGGRIGLLEDWPSRTRFTYDPIHFTCESAPLTGTFDGFFNWVQYATYIGRQLAYGVQCDHWVLTTSDVTASLFNQGTTPVNVVTQGVSLTQINAFYNFNATAPPSFVFEIPAYCREANVAPLDNYVRTIAASVSRARTAQM